MSNTVTLPDGKFLIRDYGKYGSDVIFISPDEELKWEQNYTHRRLQKDCIGNFPCGLFL